MPSTTNFGWVMPTVGGDSDAWGTILNTLLQAIDTELYAAENSKSVAASRVAAGTFASGAFTFPSTLTVTGNTYLSSALAVTGLSTLTGGMTVGGASSTVAGQLNLTGSLAATTASGAALPKSTTIEKNVGGALIAASVSYAAAAPPTPVSDYRPGHIYMNTNTGATYISDGASWRQIV